ncbi:MAG: hypothetical protein IME97_10245 [Proteobacteria bacterium]|nr:hypothetical protein [Pseudomonadota bacterium]
MVGRLQQICILLVSSLLVACATHPTIDSGSVAVGNEDMSAVIVFSDNDRQKITQYYKKGGKTKAVPPGLAKKQELPPGLQKHIEKYGELPPGLEGRSLPEDLERSLTRLPAGYVRLKVGGDVIIMNQKTRVVFDVVWDVN